MSGEHTQHAQKVVAAFKEKLSDTGRERVGAGHFEELELLIEMAIATSVNEERENLTKTLEDFVSRLRNREYSD